MTVEIAELLSGIIFILGSICFFPSMSRDILFFKFGCTCFIAGGVVYTIISMYTLVEAVKFAGLFALEPLENLLYWLGSMFFGIGCILYWPTTLPNPGDRMNFEARDFTGKTYTSIPVYVNTFTPAFEGSVLCIIGCLLFALAAFVNALNIREFDTRSGQLLTAVTSFYMVGALLFVMGSIALLPDYGCSEKMVLLGAWAYTVASGFYTLGSLMGLYRAATLDAELEDPKGSLRMHEGVRRRRNSSVARIY